MPRQPHHYPVEGPDLGRVPVSAAGVEKYGACARCTGTGRLEVCQTTTRVTYTCPDCSGRGHNPAPECAHGIHHEDPCADCAVDSGAWRWSEAGELVPACTCTLTEDGDGENGPHLSVDRDILCPQHGRAAQPDEWAAGDDLGSLGYLVAAWDTVDDAARLLDATEECPSCGRARTGKTCTGCGTELVG